MASSINDFFVVGEEYKGIEEIFEIEDFTEVTELERFSIEIESALQKLEIPHDSKNYALKNNTKWTRNSLRLHFGGSNFLLLTYVKPEADVKNEIAKKMSFMEDEHRKKPMDHFSESLKHLAETDTEFYYPDDIVSMFGTKEYLLLTPVDPEKDQIATEDQKNLILSAARVALLAVECGLPFFVQFGDPERSCYFGLLLSQDVETSFQAAHMTNIALRHSHLSGLSRLFRDSMKCPLSLLDSDDMRISVQKHITYDTRQDEFVFEQTKLEEISGEDYSSSGNAEETEIISLSIGTPHFPMKSLSITALWPNLVEDVITETETSKSDLEPSNAFSWAVKAQFADCRGFLVQTLAKLQKYTLPKPRWFDEIEEGTRSIDNFPVYLPRHSKFVHKSAKQIGDISNDEFISAVFVQREVSDETIKTPGTAKRESPKNAEQQKQLSKVLPESNEMHTELRQQQEKLLKAKAAPPGSLSSRFAQHFAYFVKRSNFDITRPMHPANAIWELFVRQLQTYYESGNDIPGLPVFGEPDRHSCRFHQMLQLLQCCIQRRRERHQLYEACKNFVPDDDEFFDAEENVGSGDALLAKLPETEALGRKELLKGEYPNQMLNPEKPIWIPYTQNIGPMTEDMVTEELNNLQKLGTSEERASAQLQNVISDIQSFKAANPGACFEDFLRWYSPKDVTWNEDLKTFEVSTRMSLPGNTWQEAWDSSVPLAVYQQKPLFNDTKTAEELLDLLASLHISEVYALLCPIMFIESARLLIQKAIRYPDVIKVNDMVDTVHTACLSSRYVDYFIAYKHIASLESRMNRYEHLVKELTGALKNEKDSSIIEAFAVKLVNFSYGTCLNNDAGHLCSNCIEVQSVSIKPGLPVEGGPNGVIGSCITKWIKANSFRIIEEQREYVLRWCIPRPVITSRFSPQRLYALISEEDGVVREARICGSFSSDVIIS